MEDANTYWNMFSGRCSIAVWIEACNLAGANEQDRGLPTGGKLSSYMEQARLNLHHDRQLVAGRDPAAIDALQREWRESQAQIDAERDRKTEEDRAYREGLPWEEQVARGFINPAPGQRAPRPAPSASPSPFVDALAKASGGRTAITNATVTYPKLMVLLAERSTGEWQDEQGDVHPKLTLEERGLQCYEWAKEYATTHPGIAADLEAAGRTFGTALFNRTPATFAGEASVPKMW